MEKMKELAMTKENLITWLNSRSCNGASIEDFEDVEVMGKVTDMIKDLAQACKECTEEKYYEAVIKAMEQGQEREENERFGYNQNRYANGRYAPSGYGNRSGYHDDMMGYGGSGGSSGSGSSSGSSQGGGRSSGSSQGGSNGSGGSYGYTHHMSHEGTSMWDGMPEDYDPRYGQAYNDYKRAKRNYTSTKSEVDKRDMEQNSNKHMSSVISSVKEMYQDAAPEMRVKLRNDLTKLVNELTV